MNDFYQDDYVSKSELKRESARQQQLGEQLMTLSAEQLARLPLNSSLLNALEEAKRIHSHEARRRHASYVGKLVRASDSIAIEEALTTLQDPLREQRLLRWLERLEQTPSEHSQLFNEILNFYPHSDRQHLRQLIRHFVANIPEPDTPDDAAKQKLRREKRRLHQYLRQLDQQAPLY